jgi:predicted GNAT family acetyltransferase
MDEIKFKLYNNGKGAFYVEENGEQLAMMEIGIKDKNLTVYHTEVSEKLKGKGIATALLSKMVDYARENNLKVIALCPFVSAQFKRHPELYSDIWNRDWK